MAAVLLDTDILSEVFKQRDAAVTQHAAAFLRTHRQFTVSAFSRFEVRRGYLSKQATKQLALFDVFCGHCQVLPITDPIFDRAAELWADARQHGHPCGDADVLIAATALEHGLDLVTGNVRHFGWVPGLTIQDWRTP
jgi:tRNA(fMet)-specific endonuclease VapC